MMMMLDGPMMHGGWALEARAHRLCSILHRVLRRLLARFLEGLARELILPPFLLLLVLFVLIVIVVNFFLASINVTVVIMMICTLLLLL